MRHSIFACLLAFIAVVPTRSFGDAIGAQGLLGSHFGVPGLAGAFDYVVIGGGTAGLTVARRLAADTSITVAVIEAGDFYEFSNGNFSEIPAYATDFTGNNPTQKNPYLDWYQYTEPQPVSQCLFQKGLTFLRIIRRLNYLQQTLGGQTFLYDSGKMLGGTSGRNFLWQIRSVFVRKGIKQHKEDPVHGKDANASKWDTWCFRQVGHAGRRRKLPIQQYIAILSAECQFHPARRNTAAAELYGTVQCFRLEPNRRTRTSWVLLVGESCILVARSGFQRIRAQ